MAKTKINHIGEKLYHLTCIEQTDDYILLKTGKHRPYFIWECDCEDKNRIISTYNNVKTGHRKSCGCQKGIKYRRPMKDSESLELNLVDDEHSPYGRCKANNSDEYFYFSMSDYELIKEYCWSLDIRSGYHALVTTANGKTTIMHKLFGMFAPDHINRNPMDNRRENLDTNVSRTLQNLNKTPSMKNKNGCNGLTWNKKRNAWQVHIRTFEKRKYIGCFKDKDEAIIARLNAELLYCKDFDRLWQKELMKKDDLI